MSNDPDRQTLLKRCPKKVNLLEDSGWVWVMDRVMIGGGFMNKSVGEPSRIAAHTLDDDSITLEWLKKWIAGQVKK